MVLRVGDIQIYLNDLFPRRREQPPYDNSKETPESLSDPVEMRRLNYQTPGMQCKCLQKC